MWEQPTQQCAVLPARLHLNPEPFGPLGAPAALEAGGRQHPLRHREEPTEERDPGPTRGPDTTSPAARASGGSGRNT